MDADDLFGLNCFDHLMDCLLAGVPGGMNVDDIGEGVTERLVSGIDGNLSRIFVVSIPRRIDE